jgi:hypothetical protein
MSNRSERRLAWWLASLLLLPLVASGGVNVDPKAPAKPDRRLPNTSGYQIRCWQHGRLLFEESPVTLPADLAQAGLRISGTDRDGRPVYVAETKNATCLVRGNREEPGFPPR